MSLCLRQFGYLPTLIVAGLAEVVCAGEALTPLVGHLTLHTSMDVYVTFNGPARIHMVVQSRVTACIPTEVVSEDIEAEDGDDENQLQLFEDEHKTLPRMSNWFEKWAAYTGGIEPTVDETKQLRDKQAQPERKRLGTVLGVFLPCCQNIFGILLFVRVGWITGVSGALQSTLIVIMCCCCTMLTALSMSAIATNGKVPAGGSYFMISRSIGPEFGGAVGILFYLGTTIASAMYLVGAVEVFLASIFGDITTDAALFNNTRVYGTILLLLVMCCVLLGIKFVSRFAAIGLVAVLCSIICVYLGVFTIKPSGSPYVCSLGGRLLASKFYNVNGTMDCSKNETGPIYQTYCANPDVATNESCAFFQNSEILYYPAMPGLSSNKFFENFLPSFYREKGEAYDKSYFPPKREFGQGPNIADVTTSFTILLAIYFPSATGFLSSLLIRSHRQRFYNHTWLNESGIMAGSNRSGDLTNPQVSVPLGTITAIAVTSFVYLSTPLLFAAVCDGAVMRDKFGESYGGGLLVAAFAWPNQWVILIGSCLSTIGAGLQCLTGAPRLLQAIAQDNVMPFLHPFKVTTRRGEPLRAQLLSYCISQIGMLIASIDSLTPLITMFFLMCYGFVNLATMLNGFLREPSWRPRFKLSHWFLSFIGLCLCIALMFISSWYYTIVAWAIAGAIYKYIEYRGASKEWGDATRGLQMSTAKRAILKLGIKPIHTKNWRPQILVFVPLDDNLEIRHDRLLDLAYQLKAGHGLTLVVSIIQGDVIERQKDAEKAKNILDAAIHKHRIRGLPEVLVANSVSEGMKNMVQCAGLGNLRHNTLMISFPEDWRTDSAQGGMKLTQFISTVRVAQACNIAMLVLKGIDQFPRSKASQMNGTVDVWCIVHDGGLLLLTSYLLMRNRVWRKCELRVFVVASEGDDTTSLKNAMTKWVYDLRINASVEVVAMSTADISAYVAQRTATIEQRRQLTIEMGLSSTEARRDPQIIMDQHRKSVDYHELRSTQRSKDGKDLAAINSVITPTSVKVVLPADLNTTQDSGTFLSSSTPDAEKMPMLSSDSRQTTHSVKFATEPVTAISQEHFPNGNGGSGGDKVQLAVEEEDDGGIEGENRNLNQFTFSPSHPLARKVAEAAAGGGGGPMGNTLSPPTSPYNHAKPSDTERRLHCATRLNELIKTHSSQAALVIANRPNPSASAGSEYYFMDYIEALTEGLPLVLLVRGTGREVMTAFSE